jgi:hypothetical protein
MKKSKRSVPPASGTESTHEPVRIKVFNTEVVWERIQPLGFIKQLRKLLVPRIEKIGYRYKRTKTKHKHLHDLFQKVCKQAEASLPTEDRGVLLSYLRGQQPEKTTEEYHSEFNALLDEQARRAEHRTRTMEDTVMKIAMDLDLGLGIEEEESALNGLLQELQKAKEKGRELYDFRELINGDLELHFKPRKQQKPDKDRRELLKRLNLALRLEW